MEIAPKKSARLSRRSPRGERGLKSKLEAALAELLGGSLPPRGAWIEMNRQILCSRPLSSRSPRGERGLKFLQTKAISQNQYRRSPRGERGLKYPRLPSVTSWVSSLPPRGAWIEIQQTGSDPVVDIRRSPRGERGLKWLARLHEHVANQVAPPAGSVD